MQLQAAILFIGSTLSVVSTESKVPIGKARVINGKKATEGMFPSMVSLSINDSMDYWDHDCGGTLLSSQIILTAGHCCKDPHPDPEDPNKYLPKYAGIGGVDVKNLQQMLEVEKLVPHPDFNYSDPLTAHDLCLVKVKGQFNVCEGMVQKSMINDKIPLKSGYSLAIGGWGDTEPETVGIQNSRDPFLHYVIQEFITLDECNKTIIELQKKYPKESDMPLAEGKLCTIPTKHTETCHGDSGSGLFMAPGLVAGIVSGGTVDCTIDAQWPDVYTDVFYFRNWIKATMKELEEN